MGRMTALRKANGATMAQQLAPQVESATVPFQTRGSRHPKVVRVEPGFHCDVHFWIRRPRPSRLSACSAAHHRITSGNTQKEWNIPFNKAKVVSRGTL